MYFIGLMSGTSVDGIDAVLVSFAPESTPELRATRHLPYTPEIRQRITELCLPGANELGRLGELDMALGTVFAEAVHTLLAKTEVHASEVTAIGSHGQTVRHGAGSGQPYSVQIGNPAVIAEKTGIRTVADFRARDIAAGGQGAPLAPAFHQAVFHSNEHDRVIINIGGIANITYLPANKDATVIGFDTGPGNTLLDQWINRHQGDTYDRDGAWAATGRVSFPLLDRLLADSYFAASPPKSTGRELFNLDWLDERLADLGESVSPEDVQATLARLTARSIAGAVHNLVPEVKEIYVCGGGCHNPVVMTALVEELDAQVSTTETLGIHPDWVEAMAFAWLAKQTLEGHPGNLPSVTGARHPVILGGIYPGVMRTED